MKTTFKMTAAVLGLALLASVAQAQSPSAGSDHQRARDAARAREAQTEKALVKKLRASIIPQFAKMEGMTATKVDQLEKWATTGTYATHMTTADGSACRVQVNTTYRAFEFEDLSDMKSFYRSSRAKVLVALCGKAQTKKLVVNAAETINILLGYAQTYGTDNEDYQKLERLAIAGQNLSVNVYQNECQLERWTISASCLSGRGDHFHSRDLLKSPKGLLFDR